MGIFGVPKEIRSDGGSQFTSKLSEDLSALFGYKHFVVVPYRSQANGLAERHMTEVMKHLRDLVGTANKRKLEPLSSIGSKNYLLFSGWNNRHPIGSSDHWGYRKL